MEKFQRKFYIHFKELKGGSPSLVVMGGDSRPRGRGFESRYRRLDGHKKELKLV